MTVRGVGAVTRREFLAAGVAAAGSAALARREADGQPLVAKVRCEGVLVDGMPDADAAYRMLDEAARLLSGQALPDLLAGLASADEVVGLKVNCLAGFEFCTNLEVVQAVARGLLEAGHPEEKIVIWDRFQDHLARCMYPLNANGPGVRCYGGEGVAGIDPEVFYASDLGDGEPSHFYQVLTRDVQKVINIPVPKDHNCAGVTGCLKNLAFGAVNNTVRFHGAPYYCDPMTAEICAHPALADKVVLHVMDAVRGLYDGGPVVSNPDAVFDHHELWLTRDPVAADSLALELINRKRADAGLAPVGEESPPAKHIDTAARMGLGVKDLTPDDVAFADIS